MLSVAAVASTAHKAWGKNSPLNVVVSRICGCPCGASAGRSRWMCRSISLREEFHNGFQTWLTRYRTWLRKGIWLSRTK